MTMTDISLTDLEIHSFTRFDRDWALLTAGTSDDFNSMTISWGGLGTIWGMPVAFLVVKPVRYTFEFLCRHDELTLSWFGPEYKKALKIFGSKSGRDTDRVAETGLTPGEVDGAISYQEANEVMVCRKVFMQQLDRSKFPEEVLQWYPEGTREEHAHYLVIAQVKRILRNQK